MLDIPHIGFIVAAYGVALVVILAMIAIVSIDYRDLGARLRALEARRNAGDSE